MPNFLWWSVVVGLLSWAAGFRRSRPSVALAEKPIPLRVLLLAIWLPLILFLLTRLEYFSRASAWAQGFLLGGAGAALAGWLLLRAWHNGSENGILWRSATSGAMSMALPVAALPLIFSGETTIAILLGTALSWTVTFVFLLLTFGQANTREHDEKDEIEDCRVLCAAHLIIITTFAVVLFVAAALGIYREAIYSEESNGTWSTLAVSTAAALLLALLGHDWLVARNENAGAVFTAVSIRADDDANLQDNTTRGWQMVFALVLAAILILICVAGVLGMNNFELRVLAPPLLGLAGGLLLCRLICDETMHHESTYAPPLSALLVLAGTMAAYFMLQGFGVALLLLAASLPIILILPVSDANRLKSASPHLAILMAFGAMILLFHLFSTRFREALRDVALNDHYALFGFLIGALLPALIVRALPEKASTTRQIFGLGFGVLTALLIVTTLLLIWGAKCAPALMMGLALSCALGGGNKNSFIAMMTPLPALVLALTLVQWTGDVIPFADLPRLARVQILAAATTALALLYALYYFAARWSARSAQDRVL